MQYPIILLALAATSSAIDILGFGGSTYVAEHYFHSNGNDQVCHGSAKGEIRYRGAGYSFEPTKRSEHNDSNDLENANETKQSCVGPDRVHLIDGQEYAVTGIEDTIVAEM
ncbi:unnamed protein product [Alternaria alternata]